MAPERYSGKAENTFSESWKPSNIEPLIRVIPKELGITPEGISRFDRHMVGFGISEAKMTTLLYLLPDYPQGVPEIHKAITSSFTEEIWFPGMAGTRKAYLDDSLVA